MSDLEASTLWTDPARTRYFRIPDGELLPPGDFTLSTLTGRVMRVEEAAVAAFEIAEAEAKEWVKGEFGKLLDGARAGIDRFTERLRQGPGGAGGEEPDDSASQGADNSRPRGSRGS